MPYGGGHINLFAIWSLIELTALDKKRVRWAWRMASDFEAKGQKLRLKKVYFQGNLSYLGRADGSSLTGGWRAILEAEPRLSVTLGGGWRAMVVG